MPTAGQTMRYCLNLSDGTYWVKAMLGTQLNTMARNQGNNFKGRILRIGEYVNNDVNGRKVMIILSMNFISEEERRTFTLMKSTIFHFLI